MSDPTDNVTAPETDEYPDDGSIEEVEAWVERAADAADRVYRVEYVLAAEAERDKPRVGITEKNWASAEEQAHAQAEAHAQANDGSDPTDVATHGPSDDVPPAAGDEDQTVESADEGGAVEVVTATGPKLLALRSAASPDAPEVALPVAGTLATEDCYAEIVLAGTITPTFQLIAKAGVAVNPGDVAALPPR